MRFRVGETGCFLVVDGADRQFLLTGRTYTPHCPKCGAPCRVIKLINKGARFCDECDGRPWREV